VFGAGSVSSRRSGVTTRSVPTCMKSYVSHRQLVSLSVAIPQCLVRNLLRSLSQPVFRNTGPGYVCTVRFLARPHTTGFAESVLLLWSVTSVTTGTRLLFGFDSTAWLGLCTHGNLRWSAGTLRCRQSFSFCWNGSSYNLMHSTMYCALCTTFLLCLILSNVASNPAYSIQVTSPSSHLHPHPPSDRRRLTFSLYADVVRLTNIHIIIIIIITSLPKVTRGPHRGAVAHVRPLGPRGPWHAPNSPLWVPLTVDRLPNPTICLIPGPIRPTMPNGIRI